MIPDMFKVFKKADRAADAVTYWPEAIRWIVGGILTVGGIAVTAAWHLLDLASVYGIFGHMSVFLVSVLILSVIFAIV